MLALLLLAVLQTAELGTPQAFGWYEWLLEQGGYGRLPRERAAFLIREDDGTMTLEPWPDGGYRHARFEGRIPPRTVALLHTHPYGERMPSWQDREEARRLGLPVLVVTTEAVVAARPDGAAVTLARGRWSSR